MQSPFTSFIRLFVFILAVYTLYLVIDRFVIGQSENEFISEALQKVYDEWRECIDNEMGSFQRDAMKVWDNFGNVSNTCQMATILKDLRIGIYTNKEESKFHILPIKSYHDSVIVSIGVGDDIVAELKLRKELSSLTRFYGADPNPESAEVFKPIGTFFPYAISGQSGLQTASVLTNGTYETKKVQHLDLVSFLQMLESPNTLIDDLWIDAEGGEYSMMPFFLRDGKLDQYGFTVCQFNLEVHYPNDDQKKAFHRFVNGILNDRRYLFLRTAEIPGLYRTYFVNFEDPTCGKKYLVEP